MARFGLAVGVVVAAVVAGTTASVDSQEASGRTATARASTARPFVPPKTPWGDPDLQGGWTNVNENGIPFERPDALAGKQLESVDDSELAELVKERDEARVRGAAAIGGRETGAGPVHWYEHYGAKNSRAWMVVDPPDGRIPPQTPAALARLGGRAGGRGGRAGGAGDGGRADSWLDRSLYDRCITRGLPGSMMPAIYGNAYDITQAPGIVAIRYEMVHETRIIRLDTTPRTGLRSHMGEARGRFEGDTLVVETIGFDPRSAYRNGSPKMKLTERFKPVAADSIQWSMTVDDPDTWTRPWTFAMTLTADPHQPLFEYACHEGNYAMRNILSAARAEEAAAAGGSQK
jgi:hypothetical protein